MSSFRDALQTSPEDEHLEQELPSVQRCSLSDIRTQYRELWQDLQRQHQGASKTALRQLLPATYAWLYRNDREWLNQNSPAARQPVSQCNRVGWQERDKQILAEVTRAVQRLLLVEKPVRITTSRVAKAIGQLTLIEQQLDKMPLTKTYLNSVVEDVEDFQIRRVRWAAEQIDRRGESIEPWKIIRIAGLKANYSEKVERAIEQAIRSRFVVLCLSNSSE